MPGHIEGNIERSIDELYAQDPERADATIFGRKTGLDRRGFLGGAGLATVGAAVGGVIPFASNMPGGLIPAEQAPHPVNGVRERSRTAKQTPHGFSA